jgi:hypothetical protein
MAMVSATFAAHSCSPVLVRFRRNLDFPPKAMTLRVRESKTDAGIREVDQTLVLAEDLGTFKVTPGRGAAMSPVFASLHHGRRDETVLSSLFATAFGVDSRTRDRGWKQDALSRRRRDDRANHPPPNAPEIRESSDRSRGRSGLRHQQLDHVSTHFTHFTMDAYAKATKRRNRLTGSNRVAFDQAIGRASRPGLNCDRASLGGGTRRAKRFVANGR